MATITLAVTVVGVSGANYYFIDGVRQATISAIPGNTYKFDQSAGSNSGHPLRLSITSNGTHAGGSAYTTGVTTSGTPGSSGAYTQISVTALTVQSLYYYCTQHSNMGGSFNVGSSSTLGLKEMSGFPIQNLTADPVPFAQSKENNPYAGAWASGGNMPSNFSLQGSFGTRDATITGGGSGPGMGPPGYGAIGLTYNGTSWSEISEINTLRSGSSGFGVSTAGLIGGGYTNIAPDGNKAFVESWNGSAWSEVADISSNRTNAGTAGTYTAGLLFGGSVAPVTAVNESWNGSVWTEVGDLNTARTRSLGQSVGTQTAAMMIGGEGVTVTEQWNGSSWTEVNELNTPREIGGGNGIVTSAIAVSGRLVSPNAVSALVEAYDGTSWTEVNDVSTGRVYTSATGTGAGNAGTQSLFYGGATTGSTANTNATEEWSFSGINPTDPAVGYSDAIVGQMYYNSTSGSFKAIKSGSGSWASGGNLNVKRKGIQGFGIQTAAIAVGGQGGPSNTAQTLCESYNGNSWTEVNDVNTGKTTRGNCGVQTAGLLIGGAPATTDTEEWDGTSWTETANYPQSIVDPFLCGVQTAAFCISGGEPFVAATNTYNGSSFTSSTAINTARNAGGASGSTTAAVIAGGNTNPGAVALTELWNGSSWTEVGDLNTARNLLNSSGTTNTAMLVFGGNPNQSKTEQWNGSSWTEIADMATGRQEAGGTTNGSTSLAAIWGGSISGTSQTITEEWTIPDFEIKTLTTS